VNLELKTFQEIAAEKLFAHTRKARRDAADGEAQAIVLSSPTGSGKTITLTALLELIAVGDENTDGDPDAVFLWLSDSPELNFQSRDKILAASTVFKPSALVVIESPFSQERFEPGKIYFLNTQKLSKDTLLTKPGDGRDFTIWQTIQNTAAAKPGSFYVIIDEAHRGMAESNKRALAEAQSIMQRFIKGWSEVGLQPVKLVIGMSATPERFNDLLAGSGRTKREYLVKPHDVRLSGLLKDKITLFHPEDDQPGDWTMLEEAAKRWKRFKGEWKDYCRTQKISERVEPVLVVQVADGGKDELTRSDLNKAVEVIERAAGPFGAGALAHCFEVERDVAAFGHNIRKIEPSKIQKDESVRVVFFKMALSTGWDCPRAEVMMSFRRAQDHTLIAQLVGRMVRTPLARSVEGNEFLNTVSLYLPHYDAGGVKKILDKLNNPDPENGAGVDTEDGTDYIILHRAEDKAECFAKLENLPSYRVETIRRLSHTQRLIRFARALAHAELDDKALDAAKKLVVETLHGEIERLRKEESFVGKLAANQELVIKEVAVEYGEWKELPAATTLRVKVAAENIEDLFFQCSRKLGEGLHMEYAKSKRNRHEPWRPKLELYGALQDKMTWQRLEKASGERLDTLMKEFAPAIRKLRSSQREEFNRINRSAKTPQTEPLLLPPSLELRKENQRWEKHLYVDDKNGFSWDANTWEEKVLKEALAEKSTVGWLRNIPRRPWALCVPYVLGGEDKPLYPDLIVFRRVKGEIIADLLDPHDSGLPDAVEKAVGLARFAEKHGMNFGRIELITINAKKQIQRLDLTKPSVRDKVKKVTSREHLDQLFKDSE
jgi:type III restriction enzyme